MGFIIRGASLVRLRLGYACLLTYLLYLLILLYWTEMYPNLGLLSLKKKKCARTAKDRRLVMADGGRRKADGW